jgi:hypothetical protein
MDKDLITAMLDGDDIQTRVDPGRKIEDGLEWVDENGFLVSVPSIKELNHIERYCMPINKAGMVYVGNVVDVSDPGEILINTGRGEGIKIDSRKMDVVPEIGASVKMVGLGDFWKVSIKSKNNSHERN